MNPGTGSIFNPLNAIRPKLQKPASKTAMFGLIVLTLLYFFDEFDTAAFGVLAPDIEKTFHLTDQKFISIVILNVSLVLLLAIPVSYLADRIKRTPLVVISGVLAGLFSFGTGIVGTVGLLVLVRFGNGLGLLGNGSIHNSLLADYFPAEDRGPVYATHANAVYLGGIAGPILAGLMGSLFGWRAAFLILVIPIIATTILATKMKEPVRGGTDDPEAANEIATESIAFKEGVRTLWAVKTLKRMYIGSMFLGAGLIPLAAYLPLYLERTFHVDPFWRGIIGGVNAFCTFVGVMLGGQLTVRWLAKDMGEPLRKSAIALAATGIGLACLALSPGLALAIVFGALASFAIGFTQAPFLTVQSLVSPARARTLSFGFYALFLVAGVVFLFGATGLSAVSDQHGIRWGVFVLFPYWLIAAGILYSSAKFVADDTAKALRTLNTAVELRRQRNAAGERSLLMCAGVDVAYESVQVLFGVDLEVRDGEIIALLGTNGAGKSTLLKAISGLVDPVGGAIFFDGQDVTHADARRCARLGIVQMPGGRSIFPTLTVNESLRLAGWMYKKQDAEHVRRATAQVLEYFPVLKERGDQLAGNLSGGEQQMLGLGM